MDAPQSFGLRGSFAPDRVVWADASVATLDRRPDVERAYLPDPVLEAPHHERIVRGTVLEAEQAEAG